jgi:hypothetical protein
MPDSDLSMWWWWWWWWCRCAVIVSDCEFHSSTSIVCSLPKFLLPAGTCLLSASNDGQDFGFGVQFNLYDDSSVVPGVSNEQRVSILRSQLQNVQRAIVNIQQMELELRQQLQMIDMPLVPPQPMHALTTSQQPSLAESTTSMANLIDMAWDRAKDDDREIRIFVSSPFRDMQEERDQFVCTARKGWRCVSCAVF